MTLTVLKILELAVSLTTDVELQDAINTLTTLRHNRLMAARQKALKAQGPAKMNIDSSRERS